MSGKALAAGPIISAVRLFNYVVNIIPSKASVDSDPITLFITWTTYGTWLPGDGRGWRKWKSGEQGTQPLLENWCRSRMKSQPLILDWDQRKSVEEVIIDHSRIRGWHLHAVSVRSNHVHVAVTSGTNPKQVRDQFKANGTRVLRSLNPSIPEKVWTRGGDIQFVDSEDLDQIVSYIVEAQDRMERGK